MTKLLGNAYNAKVGLPLNSEGKVLSNHKTTPITQQQINTTYANVSALCNASGQKQGPLKVAQNLSLFNHLNNVAAGSNGLHSQINNIFAPMKDITHRKETPKGGVKNVELEKVDKLKGES